nr:SUKH-3 domain-containing protein [Planosporangium flavigriseum]
MAQIRRRTAGRLPAPTVAAHLTPLRDRRLRRAFGAKGDQELNHHRLVREWLAAQPANQLTRGVERHAELIMLSDALHEHDAVAVASGRPLIDLPGARELLGRGAAVVELFHVREQADDLGATPATACASCTAALRHFDIPCPPPSAPAERGITLYYGCYSSGLVPELRSLVTFEDPESPHRADLRVEVFEEAVQKLRDEGGPEVFPAAWDALMRYGGVTWKGRQPGENHLVDRFDIGFYVPRCRETLDSFARVLGARLCPIGDEGPDRSILAIDEHGRVFALDQGGEWLLGTTIEEAVGTLVFGRLQPRVRDDGGW